MVGVVKTSQALAMADERGVDLVEISPNAQPPVAKLLDYDKYRYQQEKIAQEARKKIKKITVKGIRLSVRIGTHDLEFKSKRATEFITEGHKVKVDVVMRGREQAHPGLAFDLIKKFDEAIKVAHAAEAPAKKMGNTVSIIFAPIKNN